MITHPEKVLFPDDGVTKGDVAAYYEAVAAVMVPHLRGRPITMERFPSGIASKGFLQKNVSKGFPSWLKRIEVPKKGGLVNYPLANDQQSLLWMANQNAIALHMWTSRTPKLDRPDICVLDLDPSEDDVDLLLQAALAARDAFKELGFESWIKTTGSKGFHIATRMGPRSDFGKSSDLAARVARIMLDRHPKHLTLEFHKADRRGRILLDTGRNHPGATFVAPYSLRAKPGAPVSAPCSWAEIESGSITPQGVTMRSMPARLRKFGDLWSELLPAPRAPRKARSG
jgi:bifunctional non-homologous end joining protein LigD